MIIVLFLIIIFTFLIGTFLGWFIHWFIHQEFSPKLKKMHLIHHNELYPPEDFLSKKYRSAGKNDSLFIFAPITGSVMIIILGIFYIIGVPLWILLVSIFQSILIGILNDYLHDLFHIEGNFLERFNFFNKLRKLHYEHHADVTKNLGIFSFSWDKIFKTYKE